MKVGSLLKNSKYTFALVILTFAANIWLACGDKGDKKAETPTEIPEFSETLEPFVNVPKTWDGSADWDETAFSISEGEEP